jgi:hypothetical protein
LAFFATKVGQKCPVKTSGPSACPRREGASFFSIGQCSLVPNRTSRPSSSARHAGFNLHGATKVVANDQQSRLALCKYILRPPLANDRLTLIDDDHVRLDFIEASSLLAARRNDFADR